MESLAPIEAVEHDSMQDGLRLPEACSRYVESLPLTADERRALLADVAGHLSGVSVATAEAMAALHRALAQGEVDPDDLPRATARRRLELATAREEVARAALDTDARGQERVVTGLSRTLDRVAALARAGRRCARPASHVAAQRELPPPRARGPYAGPDVRRNELHGRGDAVSRPAAARSGHARRIRDSVRVG